MRPVVIDAGTASVKAGLAGTERPAVVFNNVVGRPKFQRVFDGGALPDVAVGAAADAHRGALSLRRPMERGLVRPDGWEDAERVLAAAYSAECGLGVDPRAQPLVLTEAALAPRAHRERAAEVAFEGLRVPGVHFATPGALALYASGQTTGLVVDVGEGATSVLPVYEGHVVAPGVQRLELAGRDVTEALRLHLRRASFLPPSAGGSGGGGGGGGGGAGRAGAPPPPPRSYGAALGPTLHTSGELELVRELKEAACYVAPTAAAAAAAAGEASEFALPDGQRVVLGAAERAGAAEVLFNPAPVLGGEPGAGGVQHAVASAVGGCPPELRETLLGGVLLAGGATCTPGFGARLLGEVRALAPEGARVRITAPATRRHAAWTGGSILASLGTFAAGTVTRAQWEEEGAAALWRAR